MTDATVSFDQAAAERTSSDSRGMDRSTIEFPYLDLETAIEVARAVYGRAGLGTCEIDELAAQMQQVISGSFRLKTAAAKTFGLLDKDGRSAFKLSTLGQRMVRVDTEAEARVNAFLAVPLYKQVFERYRGHLLPPPRALEREMAAFGVAPKQVDKARQAFERSARQAGFFAQGDDRLVQPRLDSIATRPIELGVEGQETGDDQKGGSGGGTGGGDSSTANKGTSTSKPLEYQLIDLLKTEKIGEGERSAVWTLVQFLTANKGA